MPIDRSRVRRLLCDFAFPTLFIEELGWDACDLEIEVSLDAWTFDLRAVAQKRGLVAFVMAAPKGDSIPPYATRRRIENRVTRSVREHLIIFTDAGNTVQIWQWVKREPGRPLACREHPFYRGQSGEALTERLQALAFSLDDEEAISIIDATRRTRAAFDVDRVTKRFYDRFQQEHKAFLKFLKGIPGQDDRRWYASVMLNRLMFIYFIQKKGLLDANPDYLETKLIETRLAGRDRYYRCLLCPLFFEGFALPKESRNHETNALLGLVPYLDGGLFQRHQLEDRYGGAISIADEAFERVLAFFGQYRWHLDERPLRDDREINPDVLGYIFEKYINQKQMGAYYTKEDITEYITKNTVIPRILDMAREKCRIAFEGEQSVWRLLMTDPDRYIYEPVQRGVIGAGGEVIPEASLPDFVQRGMYDPNKRMFDRRYNLGQADIPGRDGTNLALPTETWREYVRRRTRCLGLRRKLGAGEVHSTGDLITLNLDIRQFARDVIESCEGPELLRAVWKAVNAISVLDPTCGSGAFLFAALNILDDLYEACLDRMQAFVDELDRSGEKHRPEKYADFRSVLAQVDEHPNRRYFILKSIIINNLYGVDIMAEAVEICKLRLFLKLVAQIDETDQIEPLPDIDFNIRTGNTLVGFATRDEVKKAITTSQGGQAKLMFGEVEETLLRIDERAEIADRAFKQFRAQQTKLGGRVTPGDKAELRRRLDELAEELDRYLAQEHSVDPKNEPAFRRWRISHHPFHWFTEFFGIMKQGGFGSVVGNPPYVLTDRITYTLPRDSFETVTTKNLYALVFERSLSVARTAPVGLIVQLTALSSGRLAALQDLLGSRGRTTAVPFPRRPESIFDGVEMPVVILLSQPSPDQEWVTSRVGRMYSEERPNAISNLQFANHSVRLSPCRVAKLGSRDELDILARLLSNKHPVEELSTAMAGPSVYYQEACRYWLKATCQEPEFRRDGVRTSPPHWRTVRFATKRAASFVMCLLNSSLFYWYYTVFADCEHVNDQLVKGFPLVEGWEEVDWDTLANALDLDLAAKARPKSITTSQGHLIEYAELRAAESKELIDLVDGELASCARFSPAQRDFIANYDIKYRMGLDDSEDDQE
jgi:hypothetical protein